MSSSKEHRREREKNKMLKANAALEGGGSDGGMNNSEEGGGIDQSLLEKRLEGLRDTQESVQGLSLWCQANKRHSSAIIETWLKILRKSPVEKRLTLFYLSNDVVQHARRKNDLTVVNQWAFAVQKATPLVRTPSSVSMAIARIFRIWEERNVYSKDTVADLLALLNNVPAKERAGEKKKPETYTASQDKVAAFQPSSLISKIKLAYRLKSHLGITFRAKPFVHMDMETLKTSIKDRSHGMEVIQEIGQLVEQLKASEAKLQSEVEERRKIVETAEIAIVFYENVRGEAKIVNSAYKNFTQRVMSTKEKVDEKIRAFDDMERDVSPVPSPPPSAPSPPPDEDEFGVRPADSTEPSFDWSQSQSHNKTHNKPSVIPTESIRNDIMDALKTIVPSSTTTNNHHHNVSSTSSNMSSSYQQSHTTSSSSSMMNQPQQISTTNSHQPSRTTPYDPSMGGSIPSLAAVQQQFQQSWGGNPADNYAAMSAMSNMLQQMLPGGNNYLQMQQSLQQASGYSSTSGNSGTPSGYDAYQPQPVHHQPGQPAVDISSIPLPPVPTSEPPLPPPPSLAQDPYSPQVQQMNSHNIYTQQSSIDNSSAIESNEYIPYHPQPLQHQHDSHHSQGSMHSSSYSEYEPSPHQQQMQYTPSPTTPSGPSPNQSNNRYHPYNSGGGRNRRTSEASSNGNSIPDRQPLSLLSSPPSSAGYSNNSSQGESRFPNNTSIPLQQHSNVPLDMPTLMSFDPMEMFQSVLSKGRGSEQQGQPIPESPRPLLSEGSINNRSISIDSSPPGYGTPQSQNPFCTGGGGLYDISPETPTGMNGSDSADYVEPYTPRKPAINFTPRGRGNNIGRGTPRGLFNNNNAPRGGRPGRGGPSPNPRGFRGRGSPRGPPRGGRAFIHF